MALPAIGMAIGAMLRGLGARAVAAQASGAGVMGAASSGMGMPVVPPPVAQASQAGGSSPAAQAYYRFVQQQQAAQMPLPNRQPTASPTTVPPTPGQPPNTQPQNTRPDSFNQRMPKAILSLDEFANKLSKATDNVEFFSASAQNQAAMTRRSQLRQQIERSKTVGGSAAYAAREGTALQEKLGKAANFLEKIFNILDGTVAKVLNKILEVLNIEAMLESLNKIVDTLTGMNPDPQVNPFLRMLGRAGNINFPVRVPPPPLPPLPNGAGGAPMPQRPMPPAVDPFPRPPQFGLDF